MSRIKLDLNQFKHIKTDGGTTTLQHKDGHTLTIAHKALSPANQEQLQALSGISRTAATSLNKDEMKHKAMAEGGDVKGYSKQELYKRGLENLKEKHKKTPDTEAYNREFFRAAEHHLKAPGHKEGVQIEIPRLKFSDGTGKVPAPATIDPDAKRKYAEALSQGSQTGAQGVGSVSEALANAKRELWPQKKAKGGDVSADDFMPTTMPEDLANIDPNNPPPIPEQFKNTKTLPFTPPSEDKNVVSPELAKAADWLTQPAGTAPPPSISPADIASQKAQAFADASQQQTTQADLIANAAKDQAAGIPPSRGPASVNEAPSAEEQQQKKAQAEAKRYEPENVFKQGYGEALEGTKTKRDAEIQLAQERADLLDRQIKAQQDVQQAYTKNYQQLEQERQAHMQDIRDGHIDPDKYWQNHSKIAAGIGMILAGFNPNPGAPNAAVNMLNMQLDRNIDAQKQNLAAKNNLLTANLRQFGNLRDATEMTRIMQQDTLAHQLDLAAAKAGTPTAKANALAASGQLKMQAAMQFRNFSMIRAMEGLQQNGKSADSVKQMLSYLDVMNPDFAKEKRAKMVEFPDGSVQFANNPVPQEIRDKMLSYQNVERTMNEVLDFAKHNAGSLDPRVRAQGQALMNSLQSNLRQAEHQGVYKESEAEFMRQSMGGNPANFLSKYTTTPKVQELLHLKHNDFNQMLGNMGLKPLGEAAGGRTPQSEPAQAPKIKMINGIKYQLAPDGKTAVRVK